MTILLERFDIPERGVLELNLHESIEIRVTAEEARRKVNGWLQDVVGDRLFTGTPILVIGERIVWRVPAHLTESLVDDCGTVGYVDIDNLSGQIEGFDLGWLTPKQV